jgi:hypothetical protein
MCSVLLVSKLGGIAEAFSILLIAAEGPNRKAPGALIEMFRELPLHS